MATYAYVNPIVAVFLGAVFAGEALTLRTVIGAGLIIGSVAVVIMAQQMKPKGSLAPAIIDPAECAR